MLSKTFLPLPVIMSVSCLMVCISSTGSHYNNLSQYRFFRPPFNTVPSRVTSLSTISNSVTSILVSWNPPEGPSRVTFYLIWVTPVCNNTAINSESQETNTTTAFIDNIDEEKLYIITVQAVNVMGVGLETNITASGLILKGKNCII